MQHHITRLAHYKCLESVEKSQHDLYLCYCGIQDCYPGHFFGPTTRKDYLVHVVTAGRGIFKTNGKTYNLEAGSLFLICPGVTTYYKADDNDPWSYIWFGFNGLKADELLRHAGLSADSPTNKVPDTTPYINGVTGILDSCQLTFSNEFKREACLYTMAAQLVDDLHETAGNTDEPMYPYQTYVEHTLDYIENNYFNNIKITDIADYIGINRSYLTTCFKKVTNMSPRQYLNEYRMNKAKSLLTGTGIPIHEIATRVGYEDSLAFSKVFKNHTGLSPKAYREKRD